MSIVCLCCFSSSDHLRSRQIQEYCLAGGFWSSVGPLASALQEGPKPYSCLPNQHRRSPSWKQSTRHSQKASQPYSLTVLLTFQKEVRVFKAFFRSMDGSSQSLFIRPPPWANSPWSSRSNSRNCKDDRSHGPICWRDPVRVRKVYRCS